MDGITGFKMSGIYEYLVSKEKLPIFVASGLITVSAVSLWKIFQDDLWWIYQRRKLSPAPEGTVMLYQAFRGPHIPSLSPFALKLETFLRMTKIPYKTDLSCIWSSKGKIPWMTYNGVEVADSQFCIEHLNRELGIELSKHLSAEERGIAQAFRRMVEEGTFWVLALQRWHESWPVYQYLKTIKGFPKWLMPFIKRRAMKLTHAQGTGRHTAVEVDRILERDFRALSQFLGNKKFLMGDEPSEEDCSMFGFLAQYKWAMPGTIGEELMQGELSNLSDYCDRMKERYWPDWEDCLDK